MTLSDGSLSVCFEQIETRRTKPLITAMYMSLRARMLPGVKISTANTNKVVSLRHTEALGCRATLIDPSV